MIYALLQETDLRVQRYKDIILVSWRLALAHLTTPQDKRREHLLILSILLELVTRVIILDT